MPDGSAFVFDIKKDAGSSTARGVAKNGSYASPIDPASDDIISQPAPDYNPESLNQTRDPHAISDREILANALESAAQTEDERIRLAAYKEGLAKLNSYQAVLLNSSRSNVRNKNEIESFSSIYISKHLLIVYFNSHIMSYSIHSSSHACIVEY